MLRGEFHDFKGSNMRHRIPTVPLEEIIPGKLFKKNIFHNLVDTLE